VAFSGRAVVKLSTVNSVRGRAAVTSVRLTWRVVLCGLSTHAEPSDDSKLGRFLMPTGVVAQARMGLFFSV
jgi:hypothetical protein